MRRERIITFTAVAAVALMTAGGALAASPRQIYADLAQHGKLTKHYSQADLQRAAKDASLEGYGGVAAQEHVKVVGSKAAGSPQGTSPASASGAPLDTTSTSGTLPFTGSQLGVFLAIGLALFVGGLLLHRTGRGRTRA